MGNSELYKEGYIRGIKNAIAHVRDIIDDMECDFDDYEADDFEDWVYDLKCSLKTIEQFYINSMNHCKED